MSFRLIIHKEADQDITRAIDWYNNQRDSLGSIFYSHLKEKLEKLQQNPHLWSVRYDNVHCAVVNRFPYLIHYIIEEKENKMVVLGVLHTSLNPKKWSQRKKY
jgi:plasmid stabilization system protein ParE